MERTHNCGELTDKEVNKKVTLCGWVHSRRDHGGLIFIDLRDRFGFTQIVFDPEVDIKAHKMAEHLRREDVLQISGKIKKRKEGMENPNLKTGKIEIFVDELKIISKSEVPPFEIDDRTVASEELRLKYRYLDLRRPIMQKHLAFRSQALQVVREYFHKNGFLEIETPILVKSTPEGARDYVVPSRVNKGNFYALPQSPQLYKQILMVAGCDKYFQIARCLRDEDLRADRQPEHTQMDLEMSFVTQRDIQDFVEGLYKELFSKMLKINIKEFPVISYDESMEKYGCDKPDLRFGLELVDVSDIVKESDFGVFKDIIKDGGIVKVITPDKDFGRKEIDNLIEFVKEQGGKGMAWMRVGKGELESNIAKYFNKELQKKLIKKVGAKEGSIMMFIADKKKKCNEIASKLRLELGNRMRLIKNDEFKFCWVNDFPLFAWNDEENRWEPEHHMFSMPKPEFVDSFEKDPSVVKGDLWDLVLNGTELGSGSIRITNPEVQERVMKLIGMSKEEANMKFGFLLDAYKYGGPIHGGMGLGVDRTLALMLGFNDIREVIAFPKNKDAECPMDGCPSGISDKQMKELGIKLDFVKKK